MQDNKTLLDLITGGRFKTSADLPELKETAHKSINDLLEQHRQSMATTMFPAGKNIFGQETSPVTRGEFLDMITGIGGTTRPVMRMLGLSKSMPRNPLYHITNTRNAKEILKEGIQPFGGRISMTRDPKMSEVYGLGKKDIQILLDKDVVKGIKGSRLKPIAYKGDSDGLGGSFRKGHRYFEAEEVLSGENPIPTDAIKAIKIRDFNLRSLEGLSDDGVRVNKSANEEDLKSLRDLIVNARFQDIPVVVSKKASSEVRNILKELPSTELDNGMTFREIVEKNLHFVGKSKAIRNEPFKKIKRTDAWASLENPVYKGVVDGEEIMIQRNAGISFDEWWEVTGKDFEMKRFLGTTKSEAINKLKRN